MRGMEERVSSKAAVTADLSESQCIPSRTEYSARFERFWREEYPRHDAKITAWRAWKRLGLETDDALLRRIVKDVRVRRKEPRWCENDGAFIPQLTSYLNGRRWEDERTSPAQQPSPASKAGSSYGSRNAPFVPESQPISYAAYRKRLEDSRHIARAEQVLAS